MTRHRNFACIFFGLAALAWGCSEGGGGAPGGGDPGGGSTFACGAARCSAGSLCCLDCSGGGACYMGVTRCPELMCMMPASDGGGPSGGRDAGTSLPGTDGGGSMPRADSGTPTMPPPGPPPPPAACGDRACMATEECCVLGESDFGGMGRELCVPAGLCAGIGGMVRDPSDPGDPSDPEMPPEEPPPPGGEPTRCELRDDGTSTCPMGLVCCPTDFGFTGVCIAEAECRSSER